MLKTHIVKQQLDCGAPRIAARRD